MSSSIEALANREYKYGFVTDIESETIPRGLNEESVARRKRPRQLDLD